MKRLSVLAVAFVASAFCGHAFGFDSSAEFPMPQKAPFRFALAAKSPLVTGPGSDDAIGARIPPEYATAMTWYRVALANGYQPPLVVRSWTYSDQLPEPLQYAWSSPNGDLVARTGKGAFLLSFEDTDRNWFRELNCRMIHWPGGDAQAIMSCNDGTQRTMLIPEEGGVVIGNRQYTRAFQQAPVNFDEDVPLDYDPSSGTGLAAQPANPG